MAIAWKLIDCPYEGREREIFIEGAEAFHRGLRLVLSAYAINPANTVMDVETWMDKCEEILNMPLLSWAELLSEGQRSTLKLYGGQDGTATRHLAHDG